MSNDKEKFTPDALKKLEQDVKAAKNQELKKVIQKTHDKEYKEAEVLNNERVAERLEKKFK
jgi:hypothetical protein